MFETPYRGQYQEEADKLVNLIKALLAPSKLPPLTESSVRLDIKDIFRDIHEHAFSAGYDEGHGDAEYD